MAVKVISLETNQIRFSMMFINMFIYQFVNRFITPITFFVLILCYGNNNTTQAQNVLTSPTFFENYFAPSIKSVKAYRTGRDLNNPTIELKSDETITVEFDDLSEEGTSYEYTIIHCTYNWKLSDIIFMDYCDGFEFNRVENYSNSIGTVSSYMHYSLSLPNNNIKFKVSGNYILQIVDSYNHSKVLLQQRFMVVEPIISMSAKMRQPLVQELIFTSQQLELDVNTAPLGNIDPYSDIVTVVSQNNQADNQLVGIKPNYINQHQIRYTAPEALVFDGCNEYRNINLKSFFYQIPQIRKIESYGGEYHVNLTPDINNRKKDYVENPDLNGKFIIKRDDSNDSNTEAEYAWVYFALSTYELNNTDIYLYGELTGWTLKPEFQLKYNSDNSAYEIRTQLKQGYYNYRYVTVDRSTNTISHSQLEGNHYSTENNYQITVYYKMPGIRYWRLVGIKTVSSRYREG